jgi:hypothetical protein
MNKVNKREIKKQIEILEEILKHLKKIEFQKKKLPYCSELFGLLPYEDKTTQVAEVLKILKLRLVCKHKNTEKEEDISHHNGDINTSIKCTRCGFILDRY